MVATAKMVATMAIELKPRAVHRQQQTALMRLQLRFTAETHRLYRALYDDLVKIFAACVDNDGMIDGMKLAGTLPTIEARWLKMHREWARIFERARGQAAAIPDGAMVTVHNSLMPVQEALTPQETALVNLWEARRQRALNTAAQRIYSDGFNLSQRVWRLEQDGINDIRRVLSTALAERTSASRLANLVEPLLGAGRDCPRWAYSRLYKMTPGERAADSTGLLKGDECNSTGLAYNALRMARNEIQIAHHAVNDELFRVAPWIEGEKIRLSPGHAETDICDEYANGGPYQPGEVSLPLHVQCMCYKQAQVMKAEDFRNQVRGWMRGENNFLDEYEGWLGQPPTLPLPLILAETMQAWLENNLDAHSAALGL
jgi:predicted transcriptional regulator